MTRRDIASYIFLSLAWGLSFLVLLKVVHAFGWVGAVTLRSLVAGATLLLIASVTRRRLDFSPGLGKFAMVGATTVAGQLIGLSYGALHAGARPLVAEAIGGRRQPAARATVARRVARSGRAPTLRIG